MDRMGGILTKGLGATACNTLIMGPFRLKCYVQDLKEAGQGSAPHIRPNTHAEQLFRQRLDDISRQRRREIDDDIDARNADILSKKKITIVVSVNNKLIEKEYIVSKKRADKVVKVVNWINTTSKTISIKIDALKKKLLDITAKMSR